VTRITPEKDSIKKVIVKRKPSIICYNLSIYSFNTFDEYLEFCKAWSYNTNTYTFLKKASLYLYKSKYYLCLYVTENTKTFEPVHYSIIEFASHVSNSDLFERKLKEYGKVIFKTNAINNCIKHFGNF